MNRKNILGLVLILVIFTSGPLYFPMITAVNTTNPNIELSNNTSYYTENGTLLNDADIQPRIKNPTVSLTSSHLNGSSPFPVNFDCNVEYAETRRGILFYRWDYDGDGESDYFTADTNKATHIYEVKKGTTYNASVTVGFNDGSHISQKVEITVQPVDYSAWSEITELGSSKLGIMRNGTIVVYDESEWLPITFTDSNKKMDKYNYTRPNQKTRKLLYKTNNGHFDVTIKLGIMGKAELVFEEYLVSGALVSPIDKKVKLPKAKNTGNLHFKIKTKEAKNKDVGQSPKNGLFYDSLDVPLGNLGLSFFVLPMIYGAQPAQVSTVSGEGPVMGEIGADHNPWNDQGLTPYGEYFENNQEYISMHTGFLTITATDLSIPGRGLDLTINRVYAPPVCYEGNEPATSVDYSYQDYPWAPMGNGWMFGFPWIEVNNSEPAYIRFPSGQRYEWNGSSIDGKEYHSGDRFTLYNHTNGNFTLYTVDGTRFDYDSDYKPTFITDLNGNRITFHYTSDVITTITDTVGRNVTLAYNVDGLLANVTSGDRIIHYGYESGVVSGHRLMNVTDPIGRVTGYDYFKDYLINKTAYPTRGSTWYTYSVFSSAGYHKYRVSGQFKFPGPVPSDASMIMLDDVKNIDFVDNPVEWGRADSQNDVAYGINRNTSAIDLYWQLISGYYYKHIGYIEWDISKIPDSANLTSLVLGYECSYEPEGAAPASIRDMNYRPSQSNYTVVYDDAWSGTGFRGNGDFPIEGANRLHEMNSDGRVEFDNQLDDDWFAIGLVWVSGSSGVFERIDTDPSNAEPAPTLFIEFNDEVYAPYVEGASYTSFNFNSTFHQISDTTIKNSNGDKVTKTTILEYQQDSFTETVYNGTSGDEQLYKKSTNTDETRRRVRIEYFPGTSQKSQNKTYWYDDWGNTYFDRDTLNHDTYFSYSNAVSANQFNNSNGQVYYFSDSFYSNTINENIHNLLLGQAQFSDGVGSPAVESYTKYDSNGNPVESKNLLSSDWITTKYEYDLYGNPVKITDANNNDVFLEYNSTYSGAYLTKYIQPLIQESGNVNLSRQFGYNFATGKLLVSVDEVDNRTDYMYDLIGRVVNVTYPTVDGVRCSKEAEYNDSASTVTLYDENDVKVVKYYDGLGRQVLVERYNGAVLYSNESFVYNWQNQLETRILPTGYNYTYSYDALGKLYRTVNPDGSSRQVHFDYFYNIETVYDEEDRKTQYFYDWNDQLIEVREWNDTECYYASFYDYDELGRIVNVTNGLHYKPVNYTEVFYSQADAYTREKYPDNNYNSGDLVIKEGYNNNAKLGYIFFNTSSIPISSIILDANLSLYCETVSAGNNAIYTKIARVKQEWFETTITYNNAPTAASYYVGNTVDTSNDNAYVNWTITGVVQKWVDNPQKMFGVKIYSTSSDRSHYDIRSRSSVDKPLIEVKYSAYTEFGQRRSTSYTYDQLGRVTRTDYPDGSYETSSYDDAGNPIQKQDCNGETLLYTYDSLNRLLTIGDENSTTGYSIDQGYKKEIIVTGSTSGQLTSYPIKALIHYGNGTDTTSAIYCNEKVNQNFSDLRFTSNDGLTEYDYWFQELNTGYNVTVWVEIDALASGPANTSIYMYYGSGNPTSLSNGEKTFSVFDNFDDASFNTTKWSNISQESGSKTESGGVLELNSPAGSSSRAAIESDSTFTGEYAALARWRTTQYGSECAANILTILDVPHNTGGFMTLWYPYQTDNFRLKEKDSAHVTVGTDEWFTTAITNTWYLVELYLYDDNSKALYDGTERVSLSNTGDYSDGESLQLALIANGWGNGDRIKTEYDWVLLRKLCDPEPSIVDIGSEEEITENVSPVSYLSEFMYDDTGKVIQSVQNGTVISYRYDARGRVYSEIFNVSGSVYSVSYSYNNVSSVIQMDYPDYAYYNFSNGFEQGNWSEWSSQNTDPGATATVQSSVKKTGTYAARFMTTDSSDTANTVKTLDNLTFVSSSFDVRFDTLPSSGNYQYFYWLTDSADNLVNYLWVSNTGSGYLLWLTAIPEYNNYNSAVNITTGQWYTLRVETRLGDSDGATRVWFEGEEVISAMDIDTKNEDYPFRYAKFGVSEGTDVLNEVYFDNVEITAYMPSLDLEYDALNRLEELKGYASFTYTISDQIDVISYQNGVTADYTYDSRGRPTDITIKKGVTTHLDLDYTYDLTGSVTQIYDGVNTETYEYDELDRLIYSSGPWTSMNFTYDAVGNRLKKVQGGTTSYSYDSVNRLTSATGMSFDWDDNGNMLYWLNGNDAWNYTYDLFDRLTSVDLNSSLSARYTYDAGGRRVRSWDTVSGTTDYVLSGLNVLDEVNGGTHEKYVYAGGLQVASVVDGVVEYFHVDHLGSTRLKTNSTGDIIYSSNYEPFGPSSGESGSEDYRYTGKPEDPTGFYYFGARYYDPVTGRFTTPDTMVGFLTDPQSQNRYVYCINNPQKYTDPDGRAAIVAGVVVALALAGGLTSMEWYILRSYRSGKQVNIREMAGAFSSGAVSGAASGIIGAQVLSGLAGKLISATASAAAEAVGGIVGSLVSGDQIVADEVGSNFALGAITSFVPGADLQENTLLNSLSNVRDVLVSESFSSNKEFFVDTANELGDYCIESIRETYTIPAGTNSVSSNNDRIDYWW